MNNTLHITAMLDEPALLENLVEKLAQRRYDTGYGKAKVPRSLKALETSSAQTFVSGTVAIAENEVQFNMPFITQFFFTCIKVKEETYQLAWSSSLS